jgi:hypothetical protein
MTHATRDQDQSKGATETEIHDVPGNAGLQGQIGHRDQDPLLKDADTDFPEPGESPEHSGEPEETGKQALKRY